MHYNLMVTGFDNSKSKTIVARLLASRNSSIPYQKALAMMEAPPVVLFEDIDSEEMAEHVVQFKKIGVRFKAIAVQPAVQARESEIPSTPPMHKPVLITGTPVLSEHKGIPSRTSDISEVPEKKRKWYTMKRFHLGAFAVVAAYILVMTFLFRIQKTRSPLSGGDLQNGNAMSRVTGTADKKKAHEKKTINSVRDNHPVADKKLKKATAFVDSARQYASDDPMKAVKFYKMAISFNKYNINAWFGLLGAYRDLGMKKEEAEAQKKMKAVFGEDIFSINGIVHPFGEVVEKWLSSDGVYRLSYRSRGEGRERLEDETFKIVKALRSSCACTAISLFAEIGPGRGMLVYITSDIPLITRQDFVSAARITYLE